MFFAVPKNGSLTMYGNFNLKLLYEDMKDIDAKINNFDFYKGIKIEVREIPSRLELVPEVKKPAPVRKPVAKSKK